MKVRLVLLLLGALLLAACSSSGSVTPPRPGPDPMPAPPVPGPGRAVPFEGWGVSLAWWAELIGGWSGKQGPTDRQEVENALFGDPTRPSGSSFEGQPVFPLGLNIIRYNIGASETNLGTPGCRALRAGASVPSVIPGPGQPADLHLDTSQVGVLTEAEDLANRGNAPGERTYLEAFANSPPWWLLSSGHQCPEQGGSMERANYQAYASYLAEVVTAFRGKGIDFTSVDPMNEPSNVWPDNCTPGPKGNCQEGASFGPDAQAAILQQACATLGKLGGVSVSAPDDGSPGDTLSDWNDYLGGLITQYPACFGHVNTHTYASTIADDQQLELAVHGSHTDLWASEFGDGSCGSQQICSGVMLATQIADDLNNLRPQAWVYWTAMEDEAGWGLLTDAAYPGPASFGHQLSLTKRYFAMAQYSRFIRGGSQLIPVDCGTTSDGRPSYCGPPPTVRTVVARTAGGLVVVATNTSPGQEPLTVNLRSLGFEPGTTTAYRTDNTHNMAPAKPPSVSGGNLADSLPPQSITTYVLEPTSVPSPSATPASCSSQTFLSVVGGDDVISGPPRCADGYALQIFTAGVGGQAAPFFFKQGSNGVWTLIEGGDAIPTIACSTIPANVLTKLGAQCPGAALAPSAQQSPSASAASRCSSDVFLKIMQSQGATVTSASGAPKCVGGYAEQNFNYPKGPAANYPTFFFKADGHGGWTVLGGGAIGDAMSVCNAMPPNVRAAFALPTVRDSGCPAG
jgi:O-glycosyl hydrolase